jgi:hypothetical protein
LLELPKKKVLGGSIGDERYRASGALPKRGVPCCIASEHWQGY